MLEEFRRFERGYLDPPKEKRPRPSPKKQPAVAVGAKRAYFED
jgi:hypothetical protein